MGALPADVLEGSAAWAIFPGDCLDPATGLASLPADCAQHIITDPPYSAHVHGNARTNKQAGAGAWPHAITFDALDMATREKVADQFQRLVSRWVVVFCEAEGLSAWKGELESAGLEWIRSGVWVRVGSTPQMTGDRPAAGAELLAIAHQPGAKRWNGGGRPALWTFQIAGKNGERFHPTEKPDDLMCALISDFTDPGDLVIDPFAGSGTTGVACIRLGRRFIGWERDHKHYAAAVKRLEGTREQLLLPQRRVREKQQPLFATAGARK